jgi:hypothetical protein
MSANADASDDARGAHQVHPPACPRLRLGAMKIARLVVDPTDGIRSTGRLF